jgi:hypothetical protein
VDCKAYEPSPQTVTIWHLRDQANGQKKWIKADAIKHLYVPHYESLSIDKILEWAEEHAVRVL